MAKKKNTIQEVDMVNSPPHYLEGGIEVVEILKAKLSSEEFIGCCKAQILQYIFRAPHKGQELQDYKKAVWWGQELVSFVEAQEKLEIDCCDP